MEPIEKSAKVFSLNISKVKGIAKSQVKSVKLIENFGIDLDAHAGPGGGIRQISLLALESIKKQSSDLKPGDFAENITTEGVNLTHLKIGDRLKIGQQVILEISKIGKECHSRCAVYYKAGDCIMPREGIFAKVIQGGAVKVFDGIEVVVND